MKSIETILKKIANTLFINIQNVDLYGLLNGKLGIALFFFHYARYSNQPTYRDFADEYIDFICDHLNMNSSKDFANGLTGHAWAIHHVIENRFVEADDDILEGIDINIGKMDISDFSMEIDNEIPLFSKGIYFTTRRKVVLIKETLYQCVEFLEEQDRILPLSYLNSIMYFLVKSYQLNIETVLCIKLFELLIGRVKSTIEKKMYTDSDMVTLKNNICQIITGINGSKNWEPIVNHIEISQESTLKAGWNSLIYAYNNLQYVKVEDINSFVDHTIRNLRDRDLPLYNGLTGLGFGLMKLTKC